LFDREMGRGVGCKVDGFGVNGYTMVCAEVGFGHGSDVGL
jgi:hypothetical protein